MDQNINTLITQSHKYQSNVKSFFKDKGRLTVGVSTHQYAQTEFHKEATMTSKNKKLPQFSTFLLSLPNKNLDTLSGAFHKDIQIVDLQNNRFRCIPKELYALQNIQVLNLNSNFIKYLYDETFMNFNRLTSFSINNNLVIQVPHSIKNWKCLQVLDLSRNRLQKLASLVLPQLRVLQIQSNEFRVIPAEMYRLTELQELSLDWFKYLKPPMDQLQNDPFVIEKFRTILRQQFQRNFEDLSEINFSDDEAQPDTGISFQRFIQLLSEGIPNPQQGEAIENNQIHRAAQEQDIGALVSLITENPQLINAEDMNHCTALGLAIQEEKYFSAKTLLYNGASVKKGVTNYGSILNLAIVKGQIHLIKDILQQDVDPLVEDKHGNNALHFCMACFDRDVKVYAQAFQAVLQKCPPESVNLTNKEGWAPLHVAVKKGSVDAVEAILVQEKRHQNFDLNLKGGKKKQSALHIACSNSSYEIANLLLESGKIRVLQKNINNMHASQLCPHNYKLYKLIKRHETLYMNQFIRGEKLLDQDQYSRKDNDSYTDLDESIAQFDGLQLKVFNLGRNVLGFRNKATGNKFRQSSCHKY